MPDEPGDEPRGGGLVDLGGGPHLLDPARVEHGDPVGHRQRLLLVVGHEHEGDADLPLDGLELDLHLLAQLEVQRAERLIEQQDLGPIDQGAGQGHPLTLAAGELGGLAVAVGTQSNRLQRLARRGSRRSAWPTLATLRPYSMFWATVMCAEQRVVLEDGVDVAVERRATRDILAVQLDGALGGQLEAGDHPQDRGLARARRTQQGEELAVEHVEVHAVHGCDRSLAVPELLAQPSQGDRHARRCFHVIASGLWVRNAGTKVPAGWGAL